MGYSEALEALCSLAVKGVLPGWDLLDLTGWGHLGGKGPQEGSNPTSCLELGDQTGFLRALSALACKGSKDGDSGPPLGILCVTSWNHGTFRAGRNPQGSWSPTLEGIIPGSNPALTT